MNISSLSRRGTLSIIPRLSAIVLPFFSPIEAYGVPRAYPSQPRTFTSPHYNNLKMGLVGAIFQRTAQSTTRAWLRIAEHPLTDSNIPKLFSIQNKRCYHGIQEGRHMRAITVIVMILSLTSQAWCSVVEVPGLNQKMSGVYFFAGWKCVQGILSGRIDSGAPFPLAGMIQRPDTESVCNNSGNNG